MIATRSLVSVVDDDPSVRESLPDLLHELGFAARAFVSAEEFLASDCIERTGCLILDIAMPGGMSGPDLQHCHRRSAHPSAVARTRRGGVPFQAVQRHGPPRSHQCRAWNELTHPRLCSSWTTTSRCASRWSS